MNVLCEWLAGWQLRVSFICCGGLSGTSGGRRLVNVIQLGSGRDLCQDRVAVPRNCSATGRCEMVS